MIEIISSINEKGAGRLKTKTSEFLHQSIYQVNYQLSYIKTSSTSLRSLPCDLEILSFLHEKKVDKIENYLIQTRLQHAAKNIELFEVPSLMCEFFNIWNEVFVIQINTLLHLQVLNHLRLRAGSF